MKVKRKREREMSFFSCAVLSQPCLTCHCGREQQAGDSRCCLFLLLLLLLPLLFPHPVIALLPSLHCSCLQSWCVLLPCSPSILAHGRTQQVVLAASICTRGGKAVLSRQFREIARSRIEALLASFPKLADSGTQHTTVEQDNVRFVYQPLDELYIVLITNRQSNILQDIDSLHLFAQVTTSICKSLDEREILRNAFELLSAFDELVTVGYRENLSLSQIKSFLEMESHEERIQEIIERVLLSVGVDWQLLTEDFQNKELEASEERKRKAKQLEMQRKEAARSGRSMAPRPPSYPVYTPPSRPSVPDTYDSYEAEKKKSFAKYVMLYCLLHCSLLLTEQLQAVADSWERYATWQEVKGYGYLRESPR